MACKNYITPRKEKEVVLNQQQTVKSVEIISFEHVFD